MPAKARRVPCPHARKRVYAAEFVSSRSWPSSLMPPCSVTCSVCDAGIGRRAPSHIFAAINKQTNNRSRNPREVCDDECHRVSHYAVAGPQPRGNAKEWPEADTWMARSALDACWALLAVYVPVQPTRREGDDS